MNKLCVSCGHVVGGGGNRHAKNHCPPLPGSRSGARKRKMRNHRRSGDSLPQRGAAVAGTGVPKGD